MASGEKVYRVAMLLRSDQDRVKEILGNQYLDCTFDYYQVDTLEAVRTTCLKICDIYDACFLTSLSPATPPKAAYLTATLPPLWRTTTGRFSSRPCTTPI